MVPLAGGKPGVLHEGRHDDCTENGPPPHVPAPLTGILVEDDVGEKLYTGSTQGVTPIGGLKYTDPGDIGEGDDNRA